MKIDVPAGKYIVAVSGGVDSMVLLDLLNKNNNLELVAAHFDHGIRADSYKDRELVAAVAATHGLVFEFAEGKLGAAASEAKARDARYEFLYKVQDKHKADGIITAHHQDDLIETALLNMLRGTGRKGLSSLQSTPRLLRPLLRYSKAEIRDYAINHGVKWNEDSTNTDTSYLRNYIRLNLMPKLADTKKRELVVLLENVKDNNEILDKEIAKYLQLSDDEHQKILNKYRFIVLPHTAALEAMATWLRINGIRDFDRKTIERLVIAAKTLKPGHLAVVNKQNHLAIGRQNLEIKHTTR